MATPYNQVSRDAARALEEFSDEFKSALALAEVEQWAEALGLVRRTDALKTTFPIPLDAAGYKELKGDIKFRHLYERSFSMKSKEWFDGVEAHAKVVEAPDFSDWAGAPANMAREWQRQPNIVVAQDILESNAYAGPYCGLYGDPDTGTASTRRLFANDHPYHLLDSSVGTFTNYTTTTEADILSGAFWKTTAKYFRSIKGPNGRPLGLRIGGGSVLAPGAREELFKEALEQDTLIRALSNTGELDATSNVVAVAQQRNLYKSIVSYTIADELASDDYFWVIAGGKPGMHPWVVQVGTQPEEILHDKSSELYKRSRKIGVAYVGQLNAAPAMPHCILRVQITG